MGKGPICQRLGNQFWVLCVGADLSETGEPILGFVGRETICQGLGDKVWVV